MTDDPTTAVLFDIDGTLADSNYPHVDAWWRAFHAAGQPVDAWRIHRCIGMDSSSLLEELVGSADSDVAKQAKEFHTAYYREHFQELHILPGVHDLLEEVARRGHKVVLATSAPEAELAILRELLQIEDTIEVVTSGGDVEQAKPDPGIIQLALERSGADPDHAIMVGDSKWDVIAAGRAGVAAIGVLSGGISEAELREAGAVAVFDDPAAILAGIDDSPIGQLGA
ncbi:MULTISPECIES: HAD family hydrolase [unclassified Curtobacterium]|uniref:HAD family hydrolase n=1 Tax=unclassified Curtobacterium TaxID=257496 RepID=UPI000DA74D32|nr:MULTISPECIES: HAD family hydrolase [unclassified Curtobacterium]PZE27267.1 HAD family hydrolase [Curtobacterium sp. MCBD17_028]PZE76139.1 HAD family hydrolase [Curtobacterium sp. MCBD17_019]PZF60215.1 HAD family hydrolase [Curtobacterium sp. MCBD17_034]PZF61817.1 HAD family hydrolase [Curtobacterium sp. MCBD17_013]PZM34900.1 HAD family hydrolase [Curtobacterium sp. MCBD17_031]